jgi:hypothetical protein
MTHPVINRGSWHYNYSISKKNKDKGFFLAKIEIKALQLTKALPTLLLGGSNSLFPSNGESTFNESINKGQLVRFHKKKKKLLIKLRDTERSHQVGRERVTSQGR